MRNGRTRGVCAAVGCLTLAAALTAAAPPEPRQSGDALARAARNQLADAPSARLHMASKGFSLRLALDERGNCAGEVDMADQGAMKLVKRGGTVWMAPDAVFWRAQVGGESGELLAQSVNGRYIKGSSGDAMMDGVGTACDFDALRAAAFPGDRAGTGWERGTGAGDHHLIRTRGETTLTVDVAQHGRPYPYRLTRHSPALGEDVLRLSRFGAPVPRATPSEKDSLDAGELRSLLNAPPPQAT